MASLRFFFFAAPFYDPTNLSNDNYDTCFFFFFRANLPLPGVVFYRLQLFVLRAALRVYRALMARGPPGALLVGLEGRPLGHRALQWAAQAASAGRRCIMARCAPAAHHGTLWRARAFASSRRKVSVVELMRPPTSTPQTTSRQRRACHSRQKPSLPVTRVAEAGRPGLLPTVRVARRTKLQTFPFRRIAMLCRQFGWYSFMGFCSNREVDRHGCSMLQCNDTSDRSMLALA